MDGLTFAGMLAVVPLAFLAQYAYRRHARESAPLHPCRELYGKPLAEDLELARRVRERYDGLPYRTERFRA